MTSEVEFDCEGCGTHVYAIGITDPPDDLFCVGCAWFEEFANDMNHAEFTTLRRKLNPELPTRAHARYHDPRCEQRECDHCGRPYRGPAVYCSLDCALADAN